MAEHSKFTLGDHEIRWVHTVEEEAEEAEESQNIGVEEVEVQRSDFWR